MHRAHTLILFIVLSSVPAQVAAQDEPTVERDLPVPTTRATKTVTFSLFNLLGGTLEATGEFKLNDQYSVSATVGGGVSWFSALVGQDLYNLRASVHGRRYFGGFHKGGFVGLELMHRQQLGYQNQAWLDAEAGLEQLGLGDVSVGPGFDTTLELYGGYKVINSGGFTVEALGGLYGGVRRIRDIYADQQLVVSPVISVDLAVQLGYSW